MIKRINMRKIRKRKLTKSSKSRNEFAFPAGMLTVDMLSETTAVMSGSTHSAPSSSPIQTGRNLL